MIDKFSINFDGKDYPCLYVTTKDQAKSIIEYVASKPGVFAADLETAALPEWKHIGDAALSPHLSCPRLLQMFTGTGCAVIDLFSTGALDLSPLFHTRPSVFHNMTFDYKMLRNHHQVINPDMHCTAIMARMVWHALYADEKRADLASVTHALFPDRPLMNKGAGKSDWSVPQLTFEQIQYAAMDAIVVHENYKKLDGFIESLGLRKAYDLYRKAQLVLSEMELNGLRIDKEAHRKNVVQWREELGDAEDDLLKRTGLDKITDTKLAEWLGKTLDEDTLAIWPNTEKGQRLSTDANTLADFSHLDIVKPFSKYQRLKKLTTSFGMSLIGKVNPASDLLHPSYRVAGAKTGRLSCAEPNIQQMPRSKEMRSIFKPTPGYELVVCDYSAVEVRYIAELSQDEKMLHAFEEGLDIYKFTVAGLNGKPIEEVTKEERQAGKALVLGLSYGLGATKFSHYAKKNYGLEISNMEASEMVLAYRELYSGLREWQMKQVNLCPVRKYTAYSVMGKSRKMYEDGYYGACLNHPVQAGCAEIMLSALVKAKRYLENTSARLLMSVHDEIVLECLPVDLGEVKERLANAMIDAYKAIVPNPRTLRNLVSPSHGPNWAEAK